MNEELPQLKIVCPFCNTTQPLETEEEIYAGGGCETCGTSEPSGTIDVKCSECKKLIYRKEI